MRMASRRRARHCDLESRVVKDLAVAHSGTAVLAMVVAVVMVGLSNLGGVEGAEALYVFGDSFDDNGNIPASFRPKPWTYPYGITWPGHPTGRWSDGRSQGDFFAELFGLPSPTPYFLVENNSSTPHKAGVNFGQSGAGVTYAFGTTTLEDQVDQMAALVATGAVTNTTLNKSVSLINIGVNDYDARNLEAPSFQTSVYFGVRELNTTVAAVVNGIVVSIVRLYDLGLRNFIVTSLPVLACTPDAEFSGMYKNCSTNSTLLTETSTHNLQLHARVQLLNRVLPGVHVIIVEQSKAFDELFNNGSSYGFVDPLVPCCHGNSTDLYDILCGSTNSIGKPIYTLCKDPSKKVLWDTIHPTQAAWKTVVNFFANVPGYTLEGPMLSTWIKEYNV